MLSTFINFFKFFASLWGGLSEGEKEKILDYITSLFEDLFRKYYKSEKSGETEK